MPAEEGVGLNQMEAVASGSVNQGQQDQDESILTMKARPEGAPRVATVRAGRTRCFTAWASRWACCPTTLFRVRTNRVTINCPPDRRWGLRRSGLRWPLFQPELYCRGWMRQVASTGDVCLLTDGEYMWNQGTRLFSIDQLDNAS